MFCLNILIFDEKASRPYPGKTRRDMIRFPQARARQDEARQNGNQTRMCTLVLKNTVTQFLLKSARFQWITRTSRLRSTSVCWRHSARRLSTSSEWSLTWNGEGTETHSSCCTVPLFVPSLTMVALCVAQHQTPTYDIWTAFITLDWDWHWEHSAPAQCPACTQRPTRLLWRNVD